ncbi:LuxR C-terminal-related transcriptional regulator [Paenibacillus sp. 32352]|uniref:LuxR C-terminal-related transcriptional regulator n=1 Tax=Paenibacillus sp. 32352 TaxID=1969111 RepID=UPI0009ADC277|nr:LuxR C-terminal-related transcriptional regulator [Paenibacillus sp. 32352]
MEPILLHTKLHMPPLSQATVLRTRLMKRLQAGLERRVTFIQAPAGYGKSTLVSSWASQLERPAGWLSLDAGDNDIFRFWRYVISSIDLVCEGFAQKARPTLESLTPGDYETFLVQLLNELHGLQHPLVCIFDDFHVLHDSNLLASMTFFIEYLPAHVHLYFTSREKSDFLKSRYFSRGWAAPLHTEDLRFDAQEATALFDLWEDGNYTEEQIGLLVQRTEGWVTGLKLAALSLHNMEQASAFIQDFSGYSGEVEQYLLEEVFLSLEPSLQEFLMRCSILQRLSGPLCQTVSGDPGSGAKLEQLIKWGLFLIPLDPRNEWFRFHHLFADFLNKQLVRHYPGDVRKLQKAAADWCAAHGFSEEAVEYYLDGQFFTEAIRLLEPMKSVSVRREYSTLRNWLSVIPEAILWEHRYLYFSYIFSLLWNNEPELAEFYLQSAEQRFPEDAVAWTEEERNRFLGNLYYLRNAKASQYDMDVVKALDYIQLSLKHSPTGTDLIFAPPHMPLSPSIFRSYNGKRGKHLPREMVDTFFRRMIEFLTPMQVHDSTIVCYGELLYERNDLEEAEEQFKLGLQENTHNPYQPEKVYVPAYLYLSRIARARGDLNGAEYWLEEAKKKAVRSQATTALFFINAELAGLRMDWGDASAAAAWRKKYAVTGSDPISISQLYTYTFLVRVFITEERYEEASLLADRLFALAVKGHRPMDALEIQVLQALVWQKTGKTEQAILTLEQALKYAEPDGYIRVFVDRGSPILQLVSTYIQMRRKGHMRESEAPSLSFVRRVLSCFDQAAETSEFADKSGQLDHLLTKRELAIFRYMLEGMDNQAMADALGIGIGTLKTHINHIYGKLNVKNRVEAISRGKEMLE